MVNDLMTKENFVPCSEFVVEDAGIYRVINRNGNYALEQLVIPKEIFIEAYNKYIGENNGR